jgi:hypothetical protein
LIDPIALAASRKAGVKKIETVNGPVYESPMGLRIRSASPCASGALQHAVEISLRNPRVNRKAATDGDMEKTVYPFPVVGVVVIRRAQQV